MWDLNSLPGIKPTPPALEGEALTTGLPGKSLYQILPMAKFNFFFLSKKFLFIWRACSKQNPVWTSHTAGPQGKLTSPCRQGLLFFSWENWEGLKAEKKSPWFKWTLIAFQLIRSIMQRFLKSIGWDILPNAVAYWLIPWLLNINVHTSLLLSELSCCCYQQKPVSYII